MELLFLAPLHELGGSSLRMKLVYKGALPILSLLLAVVVGADTIPAQAAATPKSAVRLSGGEKCFKETGRCMHGIFLGYWQANGGLAQFGFPITDELSEDGRTVQYTERARFEW